MTARDDTRHKVALDAGKGDIAGKEDNSIYPHSPNGGKNTKKQYKQYKQHPRECPISLVYQWLGAILPDKNYQLLLIMETLTNPAIANDFPVKIGKLIDIRDYALDSMDELAQCEAILTLAMDSLDQNDQDTENVKLALKTAKNQVVNVFNTLDTCVTLPLSNISD